MNSILLKSIARVQVGYQARTSLKESADGTHRIIQSKDFDSNHVLQKDSLSAFFPERDWKLYSASKGDILFQARGKDHFACCIEEDLPDTLAAGSFYIIHLKTKEILPEYLAWWLNQAHAQTYIRSRARGTGISFVSKEVLSKFNIKIPPTSIQQKIISIIKIWQREKSLREKLTECRSRLVKGICLNAIRK
ncbi:MAG: restriction endonuclease subunit S [Candidatus Eremiobacteraeota bacterium]|nr:restriction endonuclease subunit S [Candidatus Eremiobacteraeota bacterium]